MCVSGTEDEDQDSELRLYAVDSYMELAEQENLPDVLVKIMCWVCIKSALQGVFAKLSNFCTRRTRFCDVDGLFLGFVTGYQIINSSSMSDVLAMIFNLVYEHFASGRESSDCCNQHASP